jgi:hypothetical protein
MLERLFGRRDHAVGVEAEPEGGHRPAAKPFPDDFGCGAGCAKRVGYRCAYRDGTGRRCTYWCEDHSVFLHGRSWCQRHANSVRWLRARDGTIFEILPSAAIDDRSPNLVGTLVDELDKEVTDHLTSCFGRLQGVHIVSDGTIRAASIPKRRVEQTPDGPVVFSEGATIAWDRGWGVYSSTGYLARVVLRATSAEPPVVYVLVNGDRIMSRVPDWIANRGKGTDPKRDHAAFRRALLEAIENAVIVEDDEG